MIGRKRLRLGEAINAYLLALELEGRSGTTRRYYGYILRRLARHFGDCPVGLGGRQLQGYLGSLNASGISQATFGLYCIVIRRFFGWLLEQGQIKENPLAAMRVHAQPWHPVSPFSDDEIQRLIKAATEPMERAVVLLLLDCGLRASELTGLKLEDIDLAAGELQIRGKGGKERRVALNAKPRQALLALRQDDGLLWPEGWNRRQLATMLDRIARRANVGRCFPHRFRHTFATRLLAETGDGLALKKLLGHESMTMVLRYTESKEGDRAIEVHRQHSLV